MSQRSFKQSDFKR